MAETWFQHDRQVAAAFGPDSAALLAISARNMPPADSKKGFAALLERALTKEDAGPFTQNQRVELTLSGGLNSASVRDRFDYYDAYLSVAPLAGRLNGRVSLERELLRRFAARYYARSPLERTDSGVIKTDLRSALDELTVHIEAIDTTPTQATLINLGTLTTAESLTAAAGPFGAIPASASATLSATRAENIAKELDRRAVWLSRERTTVRITERGMMEATIAGSLTNVLTLRVPVAKLYVVELKPTDPPPALANAAADPADKPAAADTCGATPKDQAKSGPKCKAKSPASDTPKAKIWAVATKEIDEPIYREVDAMDGLIATARISAPATLTNFYDMFQKEPDGYDFTVLQGPGPLKLWTNQQAPSMPRLADLPNLPMGFAGPDRYKQLAIWSETPPVRQVLLFESDDSETKFATALAERRIGLTEAHREADGKVWYQFESCGWEGHWRKACRGKTTGLGQPGTEQSMVRPRR